MKTFVSSISNIEYPETIRMIITGFSDIDAVIGSINKGGGPSAERRAVFYESDTITFAGQAGMTLVGFARPGRHNVYTFPERIMDSGETTHDV